MKILASAPARISFLGGGSDLDSFSSLYGGGVISMAINLRSRVTLLTENDLFEGKNSFPQNASPNLCYAIRDAYNVNSMHYSVVQSTFDGRIEAGLGSSGAFSVALVAALEKMRGNNLDQYTIAERAYEIELGQYMTGRQDHYAASYGGFNLFTFGKKSQSSPLARSWAEAIYPYMVLFYVGGKRESKNVQITEMSPLKIKALTAMRELLLRAVAALSIKDIEDFCKLVDLSWKMKRELSEKVSNKELDALYDKGIENGALGGKLLGAGGGGHMLFFVEPLKRQEFIEKMAMEVVDFMPTYDGVEVRIV